MSANNNVVTLSFNANTSQAKKEIQGLISELNSLSTKKIATSFAQDIGQDVKVAAQEVGKFSTILKEATNIDTGKLDLSKLNNGLKEANTSLPKMANSFKALGSDGVKAFADVVKQINAAEVPLKKTNAMVDKLWTSMKNTVNWQISSSALHGLMSGIQGAFRYAQDLNTSLNNIRIVTGANVEEMAAFAVEANKAAKALSTTTTAYSDASLIYFQQGLSKEEVKERADVTIKMANVTRQSATEVSNQLTSIWNNFDDGTKSLEYYADVLTKLGAATASSTDEIAGGLEKFAAIADTIGLSYEYAASALATITSNTRQSEEVVGTALKTIFARIQGLNLGETLDDGTTLNKYSEALNKVGISIFDANGEIKNMDTLLDEMASKWTTISNAQQIALAQTVAGTRQYTQLVALMDNWNNGDADSMTANLATSYGATGALQEQADIYADSWEAAQKRVQASAESLYQSLINDDFFIDLLNGFSKFIDFIKQAIDGLGGMKGLLATISTYILTIARTKFSDELKRLTGPSQKQQAEQAMQMKRDANAELKNMTATGGASKESQVTAQTYGKVASIQEKLLQNTDKMSDQQRAIIADELERYQVLGKIVAEKAKVVDAGDKEIRALERQLKLQERVLRAEQEADKKRRVESVESVQGTGNLLNRRGQQFSNDDINKLNEARSAAGLGELSEEQTRVLTMDNTQLSGAARDSHMANYQKILAQINTELNQAKATIESTSFTPLTQSLDQYKAKSEQVGKTLQTLYPQGDQQVSAARFLAEFDKLDAETQDFIKNTVLADQTWEAFLAELDNVGDNSIAVEKLADALGEVRYNASQQVVADTGLDPESISAVTVAIDDQIDSTLELTHQREQLAKAGDAVDEDMDKFPAKLPAWQDQVVAAASAVSSFSMALTSLGGIWDTLQDPDLSVWEKLGTVFTTLATVVPALVMTWKTLSEAKIKDTIVTALDTAATWANVDATEAEAKANTQAAVTQAAETATDAIDAAVDGATSGTKKVQGLGDAFKQLGDGAKNAGTKIKGGFTKVINAGKGVLTKYGATIGSVAAGVAVAAVIIGGCVIAFKALNDAYNKNEIAAQKAEAAAKNLSDAYTETKGAYEELKNTISSYESARDGIAELTRGTAEFGDQISQANDEAMKLLDTYGDLIGNRYSVDKDGLIKIDDDALENIEKQELNKTQQAQSASVIANQRAREARLKADATKMHRDVVKGKEGMTDEDWNETGQAAATTTAIGAGAGLAVGAGTAIAGAAAGAAVGSAVPIIGTLIGAAVGLIVGGVTAAVVNAVDQNSETDKEKEALESLANDYHLKGESALTKEAIEAAYGRSDMTDEEIAAIRELCKELNANTVATEAENQAMANQILSDNEKVQNARDVDDIGVFAGAAYGKATDEAMEKYMSDEYQAGFFGKGSDAQKDAWARYAEAQGLGDLKDYKVTDYRKDGGVEYSYTDENGETQKKVISQDEWAAVVAAQDADAVVNKAGEKIVDILSALEEGTVDILTGAKSGDMSSLTMGQLTDTNNQELQNMSEADLQALGFEGTKEEILSQIAEQQKANIDNIKLYAGEYGSAVSGLINNMIDTNDATIQNVTQGTLKAYADTLNNLALHGGADVMANFDTGLQGIMDKYSNKSEEIMSIANNIDWSTGEDALQDFNYQLMKIGINIDEGSTEWQSLVTAMQSMNTSVIHRDFDSLRAQIAEIKELCGDIEIGDVISDEEFDKLIKYKAELADLFIMTADGYKYIGGGNLSDMAGEAALEQLENTKADNEKARAAHDAINNWGWTDGTNFTKEDWYGLANGTDSNTSMNAMTNALLQNESEHIANMGYDTAYLQEMSDLLLTGNEEQQKAAKEILQQFYQDVLTMNDNYESGMYEDTKAEEVYASTATNIDELNAMSGAFEDGKNSEAYTKQLQYLTNAGIAAAESLSELYSIMGQGLENGATIDYSTYADALIRIGEGYSNTSAELGRYQQALESGNQEQINATQASLEAAIQAGEMAEQYGLTAEHIERYADELQASGKYAKANEKALTNMAKDQLRFDKAVNKAADNMETWIKDLKVAEKTGHLVSESADGMAEAYGDLLDIDGSELSSEFLKNTKNLEDMQKALEGDEEAYKRLQEAARKDIATRIGIDDAEFQSKFANLMSQYYQGQSLDDIEVGAALDNADFLQGLTDMVNAAGMTAQEATDYLSSMGVDAEVVTEPETVEEVQGYNLVAHTSTTPVSYTGAASDGTPQTLQASYPTVTYTTEPVTTTKTVAGTALKVTSASKSSGGGVKHSGSTTANGGSNSSGGGGGGGSSKPTSDSRGKKTDIVDRYKQVDDKLDDVRNRMDQASKAADRLWGPARLKQMNEVNKSIEQEIDLLKDKKQEADDYLIEDQQALNTAAGDLGISFEYDKDGNIKNYEAQMTKVYEAREALLDSFGSEMNESEQEQLADFDEKVETLKDAISQYDETRELSEDLANEIQDKIYEWQDNNYEMLNIELEFKLEIEDSKLELVEYYLGKIEDDVYATAEAFGPMDSLVDGYTNKLVAQEDYVKKLEEDYKAGRISMDAYKEGLRESQSATIENLQALQEQKETMQDYYGNVMEMALEEIALYTDEMEELNSVLDHYSNILELVGKQEDYATKGKVLNAKATNLRNEMQVQQELYEKSNAEAEKWAAKMATAVEGSNEYETYKKNWIAAQEAANEAQDNMLSKTEEWAEAMKAVVENELAGLAKTMEESLTGGTSFDELLTSMERRSSLQEEYLTTTNQIYETNKLMRQAQQEIDKTTNSVAKRKLANFISETEQMQNQTELSQYELDIQQAKYDLLLAEIALEEAQSAKSTVRLQRDSEGNFGYVYTADQSAVGEAEQNLADKQNALYNLGLEGANDYSQKYAETMQEAQDAITELTEMWMNGEIESEEEYQRRKAEIQDYYYEKLKQYSNLYQVALTTDSNVIKDAWSTDFNDMMYKTEDWKIATDDYFAGAAESMQTWADVCGTVLEESGLDDVSTKVEEINTKSEELKNTLIGEDGESGVVGAMMSEVEAAGELSEAYIGIQNQIDGVIQKYEEMLGMINKDYTNPNTPVTDPAINPDDEPDDTTQNNPTQNNPTTEQPSSQELSVGSTVTVKKNASKWASGEGIWSPVKGNKFKVKQINGEKVLIGDPSGPNYTASGITGWIKKTDLEGFATGGYTGDWEGSYGKLAMLHQKELVLNAGDTENFLAGMDLLDKIVSAIDLYSMNSQLGGALSSPSLGNMGGGDVLEQQVHIEASFPGVQDRNEIEEAFNTLINRASQYANRK